MKNNNPYLIPGAIVIAGVLVAGAVILTSPAGNTVLAALGINQAEETAQQPEERSDNTAAVRPVDDAEYIKGNPEAAIKIVTYSDFECPFCQRFHHTMNDIMGTYAADGDVAWVFRQFPVEQLHSKAPAVAMASECVGALGGNDAFWQFSDRYFEVSPSNNKTDIETVIPQLVNEIGVDQNDFNTCFENNEFAAEVEADFNNAVETGGRGTPWSIVIGPSGKTYPLNGALPQASVEQLIEIVRNDA